MDTDRVMEDRFAKIDEFIEEGDKDGMLKYIEKYKIKPEDYKGDFCYDYPIDRAATFGQVDIFNTLIELGYKLEGIEVHPIYEAATNGYLSLVQALVELHGVDPSEPDPYGCTAIACAVSESCLDVVKYLISAGVPVNARISDLSFTNATILHIAARSSGNEEICKYLISVGADLEARDDEGDTPLHKAAAEMEDEIVTILLDAGAVIDARNCAGETPFLVATRVISPPPPMGDIGILRMMYTQNGIMEKDLLTILYTRGADPSAKDSNGRTALHYAKNSYRLVYFFLVEVNLSPDSLIDVKEMFSLALKAECKHAIDLLLLLGYDPHGTDLTYDETTAWAQSEEGQEVMKNLREISSKPRSLAELCCFKIRRVLGTKLCEVIDSLPVTSNMKSFIKLSHISEKMELER